ncbi:MAG: glycoside hydrolase family 5 protein [Oscillospiraceae bacterium]
MKLKKLIALAVGAALACSALGACAGKTDSETASGTAGSSETDSAPTSTTGTTLMPIRDMTAVDLVKEMKIGWNLGNTFDASGATLDAETAWQDVKTSKAMVDLLKNTGFNVMRVPVSWQDHLGAGPTFTIDEAWLDRVQEVVNYGIDNGMYVILNIHHEDWHFPSYANLDAAKAELTAVWSQLAARFQNYDEHLIFEGMNEPRKVGTAQEWTGGDDESRDCVNQLNQTFVDTIRSSAGNNPKRCLMIPTYAASSTSVAVNAMTVPKDDKKIIVSIHAYLPYDFALNTSGTDAWSADDSNSTQPIDQLMDTLNTFFISQGIPVVIGEYGAMNKYNDEARINWVKYYLSAAKNAGIPCIWWDNNLYVGSATSESFGLMDRATATWRAKSIVDAMMSIYQ